MGDGRQLSPERAQQEGSGHGRQNNSAPEGQKAGAWLVPGADFNRPGIDEKEYPNSQEEDRRYAVITDGIIHFFPYSGGLPETFIPEWFALPQPILSGF
jgi:hypothetical protein